MIGAVDDSNVDFGIAEGPGGVKPAEPPADDYNALSRIRADYFSSTRRVNDPGIIGARGRGTSVVGAGAVPKSAVTV